MAITYPYGFGQSNAYYHACPDPECHCFDALTYTVTDADGHTVTYTHADLFARTSLPVTDDDADHNAAVFDRLNGCD